MEGGLHTISISFIPLLKNICVALGLQEPVYDFVDFVDDVVYVLVESSTEPTAYVFWGDENSNLEESCESAAKQMVFFLVREFDVWVTDVNVEARVAFEQCASLYRLMRNKFTCIEKRMPPSATKQEMPHDLRTQRHHVSIDFLPLLKDIIRKFAVPVTPLEVTSLSSGHYISWFTFEIPHHMPPYVCCVGDLKSSAAKAKESAARKGIASMMPLYKFCVEDVNYHNLLYAHWKAKLERESYSTIKERVSGMTDDFLPQPFLIEQDESTPRGEENKIVISSDPPPAPKKNKAKKHPRFFSDIVPAFVVPAELETVFKRKKYE